MPAIERYDGPAFRVVRKFLREAPTTLQNVDIYILSAKYGLIPASEHIVDYDQRMTADRAQELQGKVCAAFQGRVAESGYAQVFLSLGRTYRAALDGCEAVALVKDLTISRAPSGKRLSELKAWLYGQPLTELEEGEPVPLPSLPVDVEGRAILRGVQIEMTPGEVMGIARQALAEGRGDPANYRRWYTKIDGQRVGPKWLVSQVAGLPVGAFAADEARRVLRLLGIQVYRDG